MSNIGVFGWIRESVRRSVLLGFSDAVEQIGAAHDGSEALHPQLAAVLRDTAPRAIEHAPADRGPDRAPRKRLGRSLDQLRTPGQPKPDAAG